MNVLFHIDANNKWKMVLENVKNMIKTGKELNETFTIEVLANGGAVITLSEPVAVNSKLYIQIEELSNEGVTFAACNNALKKFDIEKEKLISFVEVVPAGVIEIAKKHENGYTYIKP